MAQLIKLYDYISRYELDIYRYPTQFIRLKKQQWERVVQAYESDSFHTVMKVRDPAEQNDNETHNIRLSFLNKIKQRFLKEEHEPKTVRPLINESVLDDEELQFQFTTIPKTKEELKQVFLDYIFRFQIRWASSTLRKKSSVDKGVYRDILLRYLVQGLPDHYLLLYRPIFKLKNAPIELDLIIIGTAEVYCITILEHQDDTVFLGSKERFWLAKKGSQQKKVLNPLISLNRTGNIVKNLVSEEEITVKKLVLCRNGYVDYPFVPFDITILDKRSYGEWFQGIRKSSAPLKHVQLKAAQQLLSHCLTHSYSRKEWGESIQD